jgi:PHD/YefM family antitoxin component YafN of YafNO toxin-antitoxin module
VVRAVSKISTKLPVGVLARLAPGQPVRIRKGRKTVGVLISVEDFMLFERLAAEEEDRLDVAAARKALLEPDSVSLEELKTEFGL